MRVRRQDYLRRDDWQSVKRCGGGAAWYAGVDAILQAVALMRAQPTQLWSELKRVAALGDAEDFAHIVLKSRGEVTADIEINGGHLAACEPSFTVRGSRGTFTVAPGLNYRISNHFSADLYIDLLGLAFVSQTTHYYDSNNGVIDEWKTTNNTFNCIASFNAETLRDHLNIFRLGFNYHF